MVTKLSDLHKNLSNIAAQDDINIAYKQFITLVNDFDNDILSQILSRSFNISLNKGKNIYKKIIEESMRYLSCSNNISSLNFSFLNSFISDEDKVKYYYEKYLFKLIPINSNILSEFRNDIFNEHSKYRKMQLMLDIGFSRLIVQNIDIWDINDKQKFTSIESYIYNILSQNWLEVLKEAIILKFNKKDLETISSLCILSQDMSSYFDKILYNMLHGDVRNPRIKDIRYLAPLIYNDKMLLLNVIKEKLKYVFCCNFSDQKLVILNDMLNVMNLLISSIPTYEEYVIYIINNMDSLKYLISKSYIEVMREIEFHESLFDHIARNDIENLEKIIDDNKDFMIIYPGIYQIYSLTKLYGCKFTYALLQDIENIRLVFINKINISLYQKHILKYYIENIKNNIDNIMIIRDIMLKMHQDKNISVLNLQRFLADMGARISQNSLEERINIILCELQNPGFKIQNIINLMSLDLEYMYNQYKVSHESINKLTSKIYACSPTGSIINFIYSWNPYSKWWKITSMIDNIALAVSNIDEKDFGNNDIKNKLFLLEQFFSNYNVDLDEIFINVIAPKIDVIDYIDFLAENASSRPSDNILEWKISDIINWFK